MVLLAALLAFWPPFTQLSAEQMSAPTHHTRHLALFGAGVPENNRAVLAAVDRVQATAPDGGGYFIGVKADPPESPIGYPVQFANRPLLAPPRPTSYCSGSTYTVLMETLAQLLGGRSDLISPDRFEALRMQEPDGGRREDGTEAWGWWNYDGSGCQYALVQYLGIGDRVPAQDALPGDFMNIAWKSGLGHSVVFLGWGTDASGTKGIRYWSSQTGTNGLGDQFSPVTKIDSVVAVRLRRPDAVLTFDPRATVSPKVPGDVIEWK